MNYLQIYNSIIDHARFNPRQGYTEKHHIVPRSLGGADSLDNLVELTAREHFVCHRLLTKIHKGEAKKKMIYAVWAMANLRNDHQERFLINSRTYSVLREEYAAAVSLRLRGKAGHKHSADTKKKLSDSAKQRGSTYKRTPEHNMFMSKLLQGNNKGRTLSEAHKQKIREASQGRTRRPLTDETKSKISKSLTGRRQSKETIDKQKETWQKNFAEGKIIPYARTHEQREAQSKKLKNRERSPEEILNHNRAMNKKYKCEYCNKEVTGKGNYARWHGDKCRFAKPHLTAEKPY